MTYYSSRCLWQVEDHAEKLEGDIENLELNIQKLEEEKKSRDNQIRVSAA